MNAEVTLESIRECLEGAVPGVVATCDLAGTPNIAYLSQVEYVDPGHVALSFQFFNTTRRNVLANPQAVLLLHHPRTAAMYRLWLQYLRTETSGGLFERMKAKLAGIASHTGMSEVFRLRGSDVYRVQRIEQATPGSDVIRVPRPNPLPALRASITRIAGCTELRTLLEAVLDGLHADFGIAHAMIWMLDPRGDRLYGVASRGYEASGVGSEIPMGQGVIGVSARERCPIRIGYATSEYAYGRAIREAAERDGMAAMLETAIPMPGLAQSASQMAVPFCSHGQLLGVLYVESGEDLRFGYDDEDALVTLAAQLGTAIQLLQQAEDHSDEAAIEAPPQTPAGAPLQVRRYPENDSVFVDGNYLIKGVAGRILWSLLEEHTGSGRTDFSNRELRLDPRIRLPDVSDNLEARLILLQRRLEEHDAAIRIEKTGRGRFRLRVERPVQLVEAATPDATHPRR